MSEVTLKALINNSRMSEKLVKATVRQFGGINVVKEVCQGVSNHGINGGFSGFIYPADTVKFAERNKKSILDAIQNQAKELGYRDGFHAIMEFNCLRKIDIDWFELAYALSHKNHEMHATIMNALAWFAGEELCRTASDMMEG